ncbi:hypothetical protein C5O22_05255 [Treponema sp. J25]|nr:hypothetical protein C5O22_05255 [Treponema sp. J25]
MKSCDEYFSPRGRFFFAEGNVMKARTRSFFCREGSLCRGRTPGRSVATTFFYGAGPLSPKGAL